MTIHPFVLSIIALAAPAPVETVDPVAQAVERAERLVREKRAGSALAEIERVLPGIDASIETARARGLVFCAADRDEMATYAAMGSDSRQTSTVFTDPVCEAMYLHGYILAELDRLPEATAVLEKLSAMAPRNGRYLAELGYTYRSRDLVKARAVYVRAIEAGKLTVDKARGAHDQAHGLRGLGWVLIEQGDWEGAERAYRDSLKLEPDNAIATSELKYIAENRPK
ncbi:tetratricopeptide repeat protein [Sphingomonas sp.]|uniref:tetratricopeptide repeat protein n=1 Tax=Sphingomonas sp. TaxID=28214 RepID=UPI001ECFD1A8|nr:tetratricopeptide repeat protein [Sphingomonas sp.]MBX3592904.1 tetratricopeptide repeat protein [Sphingomonas sp.]